jgi:catechol 2,3-dioxygenase-like lactoylglutathione lyase family enzyme
MSDRVGALAPYFFQVAYVVRDIAASEEWFRQTMGVPAFTRLANIRLAEGCTYRGQPADYEAHLSLGYVGEVQIELIESLRGPSLYTEFLEKRGPGLHHVAFSVPDYDATVAALSEQGHELATQGCIGSGTHFAYFDCEAAGASFIEILGFDDATLAFMEQLKAQSREATTRRS